MATQNPIPVYFNPEIGPNYKGLSFEDIANSFNNGQQFSNQIQQQQQQGILARLIAQNTGADGQVDLNKSLQSVQTNPNQRYQPEMVNTLSGMIQQQNALRLKAQQDLETHKANTYKTTTDAQDKEFGTIQNKLNNVRQIWQMASKSGNASDVLQGLNSAKALGAISPEAYTENVNALSTMKPEDVMRFASGLSLAGDKDQAKYLFETPDNILDNKTSRENNKESVAGTRYVADSSAKTAANKLEVDKILAEQELAFKNSEFDTEQGVDGVTYAVYKSGPNAGKIEPLLLKNNQPFKQKTKGAETQIQKTERMEKALGYEDAAKSAAGASTLAAKLANDLKGLNSTAGGFGILAKVPGSSQKTFATQIETLQSQVFLNQIAKMRGLGALTDAEGQRLATSISNLDINLDPITLQSNLSEISKVMSGAAVKASKLAKLHVNPNGLQQPQNQQSAGSTQSMTTSMTEVRQAAQQMGISVQDAVKMFKAQGVNIQ